MNVSPVGQTVSLPQKMSLGRLLRNSGRLIGNETHSLLQKPVGLRSQVIIFAALVMVLSRMVISFISAEEERDPKKKKFKTSQFLETLFREGMGFTNSYLVLRLIETLSKKGMSALFKVNYSEKPPGLFKHLKKEISDYIHKAPRTPDDHPQRDLSPDYGHTQYVRDFENKALYGKVEGFLRPLARFFAGKGAHLSDPQVMEESLKLVPAIFIAMPITIILSGFWLEWFNQTRFQKMYAVVNKFLKLDSGENNAPANSAEKTSSPPLPAKSNFVSGAVLPVSGFPPPTSVRGGTSTIAKIPVPVKQDNDLSPLLPDEYEP